MTNRDLANIAILVFILAGIIFCATMLAKTPRADRDWRPALGRVATFEETSPGRYRLHNMRDYQFASGGAETPGWRDINLKSGTVKELWFFVEPFEGSPLFAHSFLSFVFEDDDARRTTISVSIEARMERDEDYSPLAGLLRNYELLYVWSSERDILTRIAVGLDHHLYAYKVDLEPDQVSRLLDYFMRRTNALAERPRFYDTFHSNCTNELAKAVNEAFPKALPWDRSWVLTGRSASWLYQRGFIDGSDDETFRSLTERSEIRSLVHAHANSAEFADSWRAAFATAAQ